MTFYKIQFTGLVYNLFSQKEIGVLYKIVCISIVCYKYIFLYFSLLCLLHYL